MPPRRRFTPRSTAPEMPRALRPPRLLDPAVLADEPLLPDHPADLGHGHEVIVRFPAPDKVCSVNETGGWHHHKKAPYVRAWREAAYEACLLLADELVCFRGHRVELSAVLPLPDNRARDVSNYGFAAPHLKAVVDGITDTQLVVPRDTTEWVDPGPVWLDAKPNALVRIRVRCTAPLATTMPF